METAKDELFAYIIRFLTKKKLFVSFFPGSKIKDRVFRRDLLFAWLLRWSEHNNSSINPTDQAKHLRENTTNLLHWRILTEEYWKAM